MVVMAAACVAASTVVCAATRRHTPTAQQTLMLRGGTVETPLRFLLSLPRGYEQRDGLWPMILYLHGRSRRGNDLDRLRQFSLPAVVDRRQIPFVVVSPQCPDGKSWLDLDGFDVLLDTLVKTYRIDPSRIYLTGHSMGGSGVWYVAQRYRDRFAAIAPVAAGQVPLSWAPRLGDLPVWILHGDKDDLTPFRFAREMENALERAGHPPKFTAFRGEGHDILHVYDEAPIYDWFLSHRRTRPTSPPAEFVDPRP